MGVVSECCCKEVYYRYPHNNYLLFPTPLVLALFLAASSLFLRSFLNVFSFLLSFRASNILYCYRHCGCPACVCVSVRSFLPPRASISRNIGTYVFTATQKTLYIAIIIVIFAENASFSYGRRRLLAPNATNCS